MTNSNLPSEISAANVLESWKPPSTKEVQRLMPMVRVASRAMKLGDKIGDLSDVTTDEAEGIRNDLRVAIDTFETLIMVCAAGYAALDRCLPSILATIVVAATLITGTAHADTYTYMCRVSHKSYPVILDDADSGCDGVTTSCTITWRGTTFRNVKLGEGCRLEYVATQNGVTVDLCTGTKGYADLKIGKQTFDCQMPRQR